MTDIWFPKCQGQPCSNVGWDFLAKNIRTKGVLKVISSAFTAEKGEICLNYIILVFSVFLCTSQSTPRPPPRPGDMGL